MNRMLDSYHALLELSRSIGDAMRQPLDANSPPNANRNKDGNHYCCKGWSDHLFIHKKNVKQPDQNFTTTMYDDLLAPINPSLKVMVRCCE